MKFIIITIIIFASIVSRAQNIEWVKSIGGIESESIADMNLDNQGNIIITGAHGNDCDFDPSTEEKIKTTPNKVTNQKNGFIAKYTNNGNLIWVQSLSANNNTFANQSCITRTDNIVVCGSFIDTCDFDFDEDTFELYAPNQRRPYVLELNKDGGFINAFYYSFDTGFVQLVSIKADKFDNYYVYGYFGGNVDFDLKEDDYKIKSIDAEDIFLAKYDKNWDLLWVNSYGGENSQRAADLEISESGRIFFSGIFNNGIQMTNEPFILYNDGAMNGFFAEINPSGKLLWAQHLSSYGYVFGPQLSIGHNDTIFVGARFTVDVDVDPSEKLKILDPKNNEDVFIAKYTPDGKYISSKQLYSSAFINISGLSVDKENNQFIVGTFGDEIGFNSTFDKTLKTHGKNDAFFIRITSWGNVACAKSIGDINNDGISLVGLYENELIIAGAFLDSLDFDPSNSETIIGSNGNTDIFFGKYLPCNSGIGLDLEIPLRIENSIYPNPTTGIINLNTGENEHHFIKIIDTYGKTVEFTKTFNNQINITALKSGIYFCLIENQNTVQTIKIIKQ